MNALLLAAGFGTRLRPLTNTVPKCLVPIKGKPLLQIWFERLSNAGILSFLVNTHYLHEKVETFVNNSAFSNKIILNYEPILLGTAGTISHNYDFFAGEDGLLVHADNYCLADFKDFIVAHINRPKKCEMTMMAFRTDNPSSCGILEINEKNVLVAFHEKVTNPPGNLANGAIYILSNKLLAQVKSMGVNDFSTEVIPTLMGKIFVYETKEVLADIGTLEAYSKFIDH